MTPPPETRARAVLALLDPWLSKVSAGPDFGDVDVAHSRSRLASLVRRVRLVADLRPLPIHGPHSEATTRELRNDAIDALLAFARRAKAAGISPEEVDAKVDELDAKESAAERDAHAFMWGRAASTPIRFPPEGHSHPRADPPAQELRSAAERRVDAWAAATEAALEVETVSVAL